MGYRTFDEMIGQMQMLDQRKVIEHWKAKGLDFSRLFTKPVAPDERRRSTTASAQDHKIDDILDRKLIAQAQAALDRGAPVRIETRDPQHRPHRRRHAVGRGRQALRPRRACPTTPSM